MQISWCKFYETLATIVKRLRNPEIWLLGIAATLTVIQLHLVWLSRRYELIEPSFLCWGAAWFLVWKRRNALALESGVAASCVGFSIVLWVLIRSASLSGYDSFLRFSPFVSALGLALLASGFKGCKQYLKELLALGMIVVFSPSLVLAIDLSPMTAGFASNLLWYLGYRVSQQGLNIILPTGVVEVYRGCSGMNSVLQLLTLGFLFLILFPTKWVYRILVPIVAVTIAFIVNGVRVALMAVLFDPVNRSAFNYWHLGDGSLIFAMIAVALFGLFCYFLPIQEREEWEVK